MTRIFFSIREFHYIKMFLFRKKQKLFPILFPFAPFWLVVLPVIAISCSLVSCNRRLKHRGFHVPALLPLGMLFSLALLHRLFCSSGLWFLLFLSSGPLFLFRLFVVPFGPPIVVSPPKWRLISVCWTRFLGYTWAGLVYFDRGILCPSWVQRFLQLSEGS